MTTIDRRAFLRAGLLIGAGGLFGLTACSSTSETSTAELTPTSPTLALGDAAWKYDSTNDVYYQLGVSYVATPQATDYETVGVYVPGPYFSGEDNGDGTFTVTVADSGTVGGSDAHTAPIVFPVNTPGYAAQKPPTEYTYDDVSAYMQAGFVYVAAGLRGKDSSTEAYAGNAPWGVVDLKSAVRYVRYNGRALPGSPDRMFVFGHSGGGAQSAIMGASGDSELYTPYLETLGAATTAPDGSALSDAVAGVMAWCPITSLDYANAAYEWNMGQFATTGTRADGTWTALYSADLANAFAEYQNGLELKDGDGNTLSLDETDEGVYLAGSYYDHLVSVVQTSLNDFLSYTTFPYTPNNQSMAGMGGSDGTSGAAAQSGGAPSSEAPSGEAPNGEAPSDAAPGGSTDTSTTTYATVSEYIAYLNTSEDWVEYNADSNTATVKSLKGFVMSQKSPSKDVGAFDGISAQQTENIVMGLGTEGKHFATVSRDIIAARESRYETMSDWATEYGPSGYDSDFSEVDGVGKDVAYRMYMYNPMYYLSPKYDGFETSTVSPHWRIRTGIKQGDTASTTEVNLDLALRNMGVENVDFATVWGLGHTQAETTGDATTNFITWVTERVNN